MSLSQGLCMIVLGICTILTYMYIYSHVAIVRLVLVQMQDIQ